MQIFFDTSALIKRYIQEAETAKVEEMFSQAESIIVSNVTLLESISTLHRLHREKALTQAELYHLIKELKYDMEGFEVVLFSEEVQEIAESVINNHKLKTLDSIQLASAMAMPCDLFMTYDKNLHKAAKASGLAVNDLELI